MRHQWTVMVVVGLICGYGFGEGGADALITAELQRPVLDSTLCQGQPDLMLYHVLLAQMELAGQAIRTEQEGIQSTEALQVWQQRVRTSVINAVGGFPQRTAMHARILGTIARNGYSIEKIIFESRPRFYVTALLFLPDPARYKAPYPGVIIPCGHSAEGKALPGYQRGALLAAVNGIAALIFDPIDQGERHQGSGKISVHGHNVTGYSATLLGWNTATFRIWDGMRALDYLASRPDIDASRMGCMGNSGGGTLTTLISALDERVVASSPSCFISSLQHVCLAIGPQDAEQNLFGQMTFGLEHSGWLLLRATQPTRICAETKDFFPIEGTRQTFAEVKAVYARLNVAERISLIENEGKHGWAEPLRRGAVEWMRQWLTDSREALTIPPESEMGLELQAAQVTPVGQVMKIEGARSVYDIMRDEAALLATSRVRGDQSALRKQVMQCAGIRSLTDLPVPVTVDQGEPRGEGVTLRRVALVEKGQPPIAAVLLMPAHMTGAPALIVDGYGKTNASAKIGALLREGHAVLAADVCGFGETQGGAHSFYGASNPDEGSAVMAYLLGKSLVGLRAEQVLICARWLSGVCESKQIDLHAANWAVTPALHAAVCEQSLFGNVSLEEAPLAWEEVVAQGASHRFADLVHGALRSYTIQELKCAAGCE